MTRAMNRGTAVQPISSAILPWIGAPTSFGRARRYLKEAKAPSAVMSTAKNRHVSKINPKRVSTFPAKLEACSGTNGKGDCTALERSFGRGTGTGADAAAMIPPVEDHKTNDHHEESDDSTHPNDRQDGGAVARPRGVVLVAEEQEVIDRVSDFAGGSVHQAEANVARRILDAKEVARDAALGGKQQDSTGVAEQAGLLVVAETETRGLGNGVDGLLGAGEEMPAGFGHRAGKAGHGFVLFLERRVGSIRGIEADEDNLIIGARTEGDHFESANDGLFDMIAEHGASKIHKGKNDGLFAGEIAERDGLAVLIDKRCIEGNLSVQLRVETHIDERRRQSVRGLADTVGNHLRPADGRSEEQSNDNQGVTKSFHFLYFVSAGGVATTGKPFSAMIFIASLTGIWARPAFSSSQPNFSFASVSALTLSRKSCWGSTRWPGMACRRGSGGGSGVAVSREGGGGA